MKIKKFRIKPRLPVVGRILKAVMGTRQLPPEVEESLPQEIETFRGQIIPNAFYLSWSRENIPVSFRPVLDAAGLGRAVAVSALVATIGSEPEDRLSDLLMNGETQKAQVATAVCEESADLAFLFLLKLLAIDAKTDDCEISEPLAVSDAGLLQETLTLLDAEQEGVAMDSALHLTPRFTRVGLVAWTPIAKKKRPIALPKKRTV